MIRTLPGDAPTPTPNSSHPQVLETVMTLTKYMRLIWRPLCLQMFLFYFTFCDRHANKSYDIFKTSGDRQVIC